VRPAGKSIPEPLAERFLHNPELSPITIRNYQGNAVPALPIPVLGMLPSRLKMEGPKSPRHRPALSTINLDGGEIWMDGGFFE